MYETFEYRAHVFNYRVVLTGRQCWEKPYFCLERAGMDGFCWWAFFPRYWGQPEVAQELKDPQEEGKIFYWHSWVLEKSGSFSTGAALDVNYPAKIKPQAAMSMKVGMVWSHYPCILNTEPSAQHTGVTWKIFVEGMKEERERRKKRAKKGSI